MSVRQFIRVKDVGGFSVRVRKAHIKHYKGAQKKLRTSTLNKLLGELAMCILATLKSGDPGVIRQGFILEAEKNTEAVKCFRRILKLEPRTVDNQESCPKWVPVDETLKETLGLVAAKLIWSEGQVIQEALRAAVFLICEEDAETLPDIFLLYWGRKQFEERLAAAVSEKKEGEKIKKQTRKSDTLVVPPPAPAPMTTNLVLE
jgi:hypothetical protein